MCRSTGSNSGRSARGGALLTLIGLVAALALTACGSNSKSGSATGKSASNGPLVINQAGIPGTLDPAWEVGVGEEPLITAMYATLMTYKPVPAAVSGTYEAELGVKGVEPYLAESYKFSNGDKTLTLQIRPDMKFPSGEPVNAHAVVWSLKALIRSQSGSYSVIEEEQHKPPLVKSITETGPLTVVLQYSRPAPTQPLALTAIPVYDPGLVEAHGGIQLGKQNKWVASHDAGYGPYLMKSYSAGHQLVLEANPGFFKAPKTKELIINFVPDNETLLLDAKSGSAEMTMGMALQGAHSLVNDSCCSVATFKDATTEEMNFPEVASLPEFENQTFRQALTYAVPYEGILKRVAYGWGQLYFGEWEPSFPWFQSSIGGPREYNVAKAKELIKQSGVKTPISFPIYVEAGNLITKEIATIAAGSWQQIGVDAKVQVLPETQFVEASYEKRTGVTLLPDSTVEVAPAYYWSWDLQCKALYNATNVCLPQADKLMREVADGNFASEPQKEQQVLNEVDQMYITNAPRVWVYNPEAVLVLKKGVTGVAVYNGNTQLATLTRE